MPRVDNKIHFVWVGKTIPEEKVDLILKHLFTNYPDYDVFLWTDKAAENSDLFEAVVNGGGVRHLADKASRAEIAPAAWRNFGSHLAYLTFSRNSTVRGHLLFIDISNIVAESLLRARYHSAIDARNYGRASDILRLEIISKEGGIYMDTDVTCLRKLPVGILASKGLLIGRGQASNAHALTNAVMAAPKRSQIVLKLIRAVGGQFSKYDKEGWWDVLEQARNVEGQAFTRAEATGDTNAIGAARARFQAVLMAGTNAVTGPEFLTMFLFLNLIKPNFHNLHPYREKLTKDQRSTLSSLKKASAPDVYAYVLGIAKSNVFRPILERSGMINQIAFPNGYLEIGSEATWITNAR